MASRRCEGRIRNEILRQTPDWKCIKAEPKEFNISVASPYQHELVRFKELVEKKKMDELVARYPLRKSGVFDAIAKALGLKNRKVYEQTLVPRIREDEDLAQRLKQRLGGLSKALMPDFTT